MRSIWLGYDSRETEAFAVARQTLRRHAAGIPIHALDLHELRGAGLYTRPTSRVRGQLWDELSDAPMSTEFACSRFLTPILAKRGWALFMDCDVLCRSSMAELFALADDSYAVMCVRHQHEPMDRVKMDGQQQTQYARKNWSSVVLFNCDHPANERLTLSMVNTLPGRDLHRFCWLQDKEIGALPPEWNWLAGVSDPCLEPKLVHFTLGTPNMPGYEAAPYAGERRAERRLWLASEAAPAGRPTTWQEAA